MARALLVLCTLLVAAQPARAEGVYWSTKALLKEFFQGSERVTYVQVPAADAPGCGAKKDAYTVFVATTGGRVDGYAVIDEEIGQHEPITFGVKLAPDGAVQRVEVMAYREAYGEEIRDSLFTRQYVGKRPADAARMGDGVVAISGATISSRATTAAVKRAVLLVDAARAKAARSASLPSPSTGG